MTPPRSILVIKPSSLGDVVHTLPAVAAVKRHFPAARLRWLVNPEWAPLLAGNPDIDEVIEFPRAQFRGFSGFRRFLRWRRGLAGVADLVLDFQGLLRSALSGRAVRSGALWGLSDAREGARFFYQRTVAVPPRGQPPHAVERYLALAAATGADVAPPLQWTLPAGNAPAGFPLERGFVLLHPFSRGEGKSLSAEEVRAFCTALAPHPVVIAGRCETPLPAQSGVLDLLNQTTLPELCWLIRRADFVVSVDSGPMHIAAALTSRLLAIHTWSDPRLVGPCQPEAAVWKDGRIGRMADFPSSADCPRTELGAWVRGRLA